jgi:hypothetical protein
MKDLITPVNNEALVRAVTAVVGVDAMKLIKTAYEAIDAAMAFGYAKGVEDGKVAAEEANSYAVGFKDGYEDGFNASEDLNVDVETKAFQRGWKAADGDYDDGYCDGVADARSHPEYADATIAALCDEDAYDDAFFDPSEYTEYYEGDSGDENDNSPSDGAIFDALPSASAMPRKLLLIDGDQFVFTAAVAIERETRWDEDNHVLYASPELAWINFEGMLKRIFDRFETDDHVLTFSSPTNFRYTVDATYKSARKGARKPLCFAAVRELADANYTTSVMDGLEADDIMGILATKPGTAQRIIVSQDKDLKTIPGTLWTGKDLLQITEEEADYNHLYQTLIGDATDSVKGCPGIGPVKAEKLLKHVMENHESPSTSAMWHCAVVPAYVKAGLTEEDALQQARLVRILRWSDWDSVNKKPILWSPQRS